MTAGRYLPVIIDYCAVRQLSAVTVPGKLEVVSYAGNYTSQFSFSEDSVISKKELVLTVCSVAKF